MKLCLLLSRRCNLRCGFCPVEFTEADMPLEIARLGVERYLSWLPKGVEPTIKFFGGEPTLNWEVLRKLIDAGRGEWSKIGLRYELPSNGTLLSTERLFYLREHPEVEVTLSQSTPGGGSIPGAWYTVVLDRNLKPADIVSRMGALLRDGYRRFNFLPAYFVPWSKEELARLETTFTALVRLIQRLRQAGVALRVKNCEVFSRTPLHNEAFTVDTDGVIYASTMIQCEGMDKYKPSLKLGDVFKQNIASGLPNKAGILRDILTEWSGEEAWNSTLLADKALDAFVSALRNGDSSPGPLSARPFSPELMRP